jgi:hypothetical protein
MPPSFRRKKSVSSVSSSVKSPTLQEHGRIRKDSTSPPVDADERSVWHSRMGWRGKAECRVSIRAKHYSDQALTINCNNSLIFMHGLNGHRERTWTASNGVCWPRHLLPQDLPRARILSFGYDSRTHATENLSHQTFHGHAITLLQSLSLYRRKTKVGMLSPSLTGLTLLT